MKLIYRTHEGLKQSCDWMRARPEAIKALMRKFPPSCYVKATRSLVTPSEGVIGQIASYFEPTEKTPHGMVSVSAPDFMGVMHRGQCQLDWIEVVEFYRNEISGDLQDRAWVEEVLNDS